MEIIDQIRQVANIIDIASQYTTLQRRGKKHVGLCPFHEEKSPSFTLDDEKQLFHCFGCGTGGDVFTLVMEKENLSFPEALRYLAEKYRIALPQRKKLSPQFLKLEEKLFKISEDALAFFKKNLFNTEEGHKALDYLKKRGISEDTIQKLKIGYALNSWDSLLGFFQSKDISPALLQKSGLVLQRQNKEGYYDRFRGRVIFPIFTLTGKVVAFGGRTLVGEEPKYLNSPDTLIYSKGNLLYGLNLCKDFIREKGESILVEGYTDFLTLFQSGINNTTASLGTSLTSQQVALASRFAPRIIVSYDGDSAGKKAASRAISLCFEKGIQIKVLNLPDGFDPDSFIKKFGVDEFERLIRNSSSGLKFLIDAKLQEGKISIPEEKSRIARSIVFEIEKIPDPVVRSEYIRKTSESLSIDEAALRSIIQQKSTDLKSKEMDSFLNAEKRLLQILIEDKDIAAHVFAEIKEEDFRGLQGEFIFTALLNSFKQGKKLGLHELKQEGKPSLLSSLSRALLEQEQPATIEEAMECLNTLRQFSLETKAKELQVQITKTEQRGETEKLPPLFQQLLDIKMQISILSQRNYQNSSYETRYSLAKNRS